MAYCTKEDILEQLPEQELITLTDDAGTGTVDEDVVNRAITDADATIDAYCQGRYALPLNPVPEMIRKLSVDIAIYNLYSRRNDVMPDVRTERYKNAIRFLERVAEGKIQLGASTPQPESTANSVNLTSDERIFNRENMGGY